MSLSFISHSLECLTSDLISLQPQEGLRWLSKYLLLIFQTSSSVISSKNIAEVILFWGKFKQFLPNPEKSCAPPIPFVLCVSSYSSLNSCFLCSVAW